MSTLPESKVSENLDSVLNDEQRVKLRKELELGLEICHRPYALIAEKIGLTEQQVVDGIRELKSSGVIKRLGVVVYHRALGYTANGMLVMDIPDSKIETIAQQIKTEPSITLCYQRPRRLPDWPYNLFCMIHGKQRDEVYDTIKRIFKKRKFCFPYDILFSTECFKQSGGRYVD